MTEQAQSGRAIVTGVHRAMCCQNWPDNILVDVGAQCKIDLVRDARTAEVGIANTEGPDLLVDGVYYEIKEMTGNGANTLKNNIHSAQGNFRTDGAQDVGLSRSDSRIIIDARASDVWNNEATINAALDRLSGGDTLDYVQKLSIITVSGVIIWRP